MADIHIHINNLGDIKIETGMDWDCPEDYTPDIPTPKQNHTRKPSGAAITNRKRVQQYTLDGKLVRTYNSLRAVEHYDYDPSLISKCCNGKRETAYQYIWKYEK